MLRCKEIRCLGHKDRTVRENIQRKQLALNRYGNRIEDRRVFKVVITGYCQEGNKRSPKRPLEKGNHYSHVTKRPVRGDWQGRGKEMEGNQSQCSLNSENTLIN